MKILLGLVLVVLLLGALATWIPTIGGTNAAPMLPRPALGGVPAIEPWFSPRGDALRAVATSISHAQHQILALGSLTGAQTVLSALAAARGRGVEVHIVSPPGGDEDLASLAAAGASCAIDEQHAQMRACVLLIDGAVVITAPTLTDASDHEDASVLVVMHDTTLATAFIDNWRVHRAHARLRSGAATAPGDAHAAAALPLSESGADAEMGHAGVSAPRR